MANTKQLTFDGKTQTIREWAEEIGIKPTTLTQRIKSGWPVEQALTEPPRQPLGKTVKDVQPIRSAEGIAKMKWALKRHCSQRDYILFLLGINTGLRCGDLLRLSIADVAGKREVKLTEGKTKKPRTLYLSNIYDELQEYIETLKGGNSKWLFPSRKGGEAITVTQAYRQLNRAAYWADLEHVGTHTMRKCFGYFHYKQFKDVAQLQTILNHSHPSVTLRYIGITAENIEETMQEFVL